MLVDLKAGVTHLTEATRTKFEGRLDEVPDIFSQMDPMPGALEAYAELCGRFDTYILSTSPWENPTAWSDRLLTHHKELNRGDFQVDDRTKNGVGRFNGEHIHFKSEAFPDWPAVLAYLRTRAG